MSKSRRQFLQDCILATSTLSLGLCGGCGQFLFGCKGKSVTPKSSQSQQASRDGNPVSSSSKEGSQRAVKTELPKSWPSYLKSEEDGILAKKEEALWSQLAKCRLCPRDCRVNRIAGQTGICSSTATFKVASFGPHYGEEPPLVGTGGSGTIFFSHCSLLCVYCQNHDIAHQGQGNTTDHAQLANMMLSLQQRGCHNINIVTPTHVIPHVVKSLRIAIKGGLKLPLVYNTGGYDSLETIRLLDGVFDIYMPDFKYQDNSVADRLSQGADDYQQVAAAAIKEMHRQTGYLHVEDGIAKRGLLLRHLVLPENLGGTDKLVQWVVSELGRDTYMNIMGQYRPMYRASQHSEISRRVHRQEVQLALAWARNAGLHRLARS